jgi:hypothetical protein
LLIFFAIFVDFSVVLVDFSFFFKYLMDQNQEQQTDSLNNLVKICNVFNKQQTDSLNNLVKICNVFNILLGLVASMSTTPTYKEDNQALRDDGNNLIKYTFLTGC